MQTDFPSQLLIQFNDANPQRIPDWKENASNFCLYFLRSAFGSDCQLPENHSVRIQLAQKTESCALRAFSCFVAFTLWLPLTLLGIVFCLNSYSHDDAYQIAQKALKTPPPPPSPPLPPPLNSMATVVEQIAAPVLSPPTEPTILPPEPITKPLSVLLPIVPATPAETLPHTELAPPPAAVHAAATAVLVDNPTVVPAPMPAPLPEPIPTPAPAPVPAPAPAAIQEGRQKPAIRKIDLENFHEMNNEEILQHLLAILKNPSQYPLELKKRFIKECIARGSSISYDSGKYYYPISLIETLEKSHPIELKITIQLFSLFETLSVEESSIYLPDFLAAKFKSGQTYHSLFSKDHWLTPQRALSLALATAAMIKNEQLYSWDTWIFLAERCRSEMTWLLPGVEVDPKRTPMILSARSVAAMLCEVAKMFEGSPALLAEFYLRSPFSKSLIVSVMSTAQLTLLTMELKKTYAPTDKKYLELIQAVSDGPGARKFEEIGQRIFMVFTVIGQAEPIKWLLASETTRSESIFNAINYLLIFKAYQAFKDLDGTSIHSKDRYEERVARLVSAMSSYIEFDLKTPFTYESRFKFFTQRVAELAAENYLYTFPLIEKSLMQVKSNSTKSQGNTKPFYEMLFRMLDAILRLRYSAEKTKIVQAALAAVISCRDDVDPRFDLEWSKSVKSVASTQYYHEALDTALTAIIPLDDHGKNPLERAMWRATWEERLKDANYNTGDQRRTVIEANLKEALEGSGLPPELLALISDYYIALPSKQKAGAK